ncbi:MAG: hypothetical protein M4579_000446 [Chaenotheca gracillima]|nr:MAG: hypothetical protein M4579_000446 [Chaenotheca gracillima]
MADSEDDEDMRRAIALSLGVEDELPVVSKRPQQESLIDLTQDSDHENTARAVGGSLMAGDTIDGTPKSPKEPIGQGLDATSAEIPTKLLWGIAGLDRGQMERDRLARLKRKASISPPPLRKEPRLATEPNRGGSSASYSSFSTFAFDQKASEGGAGSATIKPNPTVPKLKESSSGASSKPSTAPGIQYPLGTVKKTWAFGHPRDEDVKIEEVLQRQDLKIAILSSFQWDVDWLVDKLDLRSTKLMLVMQAKDEATKTRYKTETAGVPNLRLCFPPMEGNVNCMHSKLQLLFHQDYLRIVVPTANLVPYDWGENGSFMENSIFMIDLPRLKAAEDELPAEQVHLTHFREELLYFLEAMKIPQDVQKGVLKFDFSKTSNIAFVHTM